MTKRDVMSVAVKVLGLVFLVCAVAAVPRSVGFAITSMNTEIIGKPQPWLVSLEAGALFLSFAVAVALLQSADGIARRLFREDGDVVVPDARGRERTVFGVAARVVGLFLMATALPKLIRTLAASFLTEHRVLPRCPGPDRSGVLSWKQV